MASDARTKFLDPGTIARLGSLDLKARTIVEGFLAGLHRSPFKGFSVEFAEYRQYLPGDDLATLDWKVYGRTDRHFVKKFEEETNLDCHILIDVSQSMGYASGEVTKIRYASFLAAALAYLMNRQRDAVGLITFDEQFRQVASARPRIGRSHVIYCVDLYQDPKKGLEGSGLHQDITATIESHLRRTSLVPVIERSHGVKVTHTDLLVAAVARALRQHPRMNASWSNGTIALNPEINVALAMAVENAVVTAVIKGADRAALKGRKATPGCRARRDRCSSPTRSRRRARNSLGRASSTFPPFP